MDHQNPYANVILDEIVDDLVGDFFDRNRRACEEHIRDYCHRRKVFDSQKVEKIIKRVWWEVANKDLTWLPEDFFNAILYK